MRVLFIGCIAFSEKMLEQLIALDTELVGVVTKKESNFNADFVDLSVLAKSDGIPFHYTGNANAEETKSWIRDKEPDVIFCLGWSQLLDKTVLNIPPSGVVGYHPSELPENRGRHPLIWAIALGLDHTASTFFIMDAGADTGDIISQRRFTIGLEEYASDVYRKMISTAQEQLEEIVDAMSTGDMKRIAQNPDAGNAWRKRGMKDGEIDFRMHGVDIYNLVRALSRPYVGAHIRYEDDNVKVWGTKINDNFTKGNIEPGKVLDVSERDILVKTADSSIWILNHNFESLPKVGEYL